jgi:CheY-like chemotaxis protein
VEQLYKRVENIDDKVKKASLPYLQWKVLFLIGEHSDAAEISSLLSEDISKIKNALASLESDGFIEKVSKVKETAKVDAINTQVAASGIADQLLVEEEFVSEEEEVKSEEAGKPEKIEMKTSEKESFILDEKDFKPVKQGKTYDKKGIIDINKDFLTEDLIPVDEAARIKKQKPESEIVHLDEVTTKDKSETDVEDFDLDLDVDEGSKEDISVQQEIQTKKPEVKESAEEEEKISDVSKKTIVVIDDSIVIRKMIEIALEDEDFNIVTAISGKEGLEIIEARQPNLVILDMLLPDMNGIEVLKTIKSGKKVPVIMLSGKDSPQLIESAKEIGVDDFLPKPFRDEDLVEKVKTLVGA